MLGPTRPSGSFARRDQAKDIVVARRCPGAPSDERVLIQAHRRRREDVDPAADAQAAGLAAGGTVADDRAVEDRHLREIARVDPTAEAVAARTAPAPVGVTTAGLVALDGAALESSSEPGSRRRSRRRAPGRSRPPKGIAGRAADASGVAAELGSGCWRRSYP